MPFSLLKNTWPASGAGTTYSYVTLLNASAREHGASTNSAVQQPDNRSPGLRRLGT
jgi:hypothetical protein